MLPSWKHEFVQGILQSCAAPTADPWAPGLPNTYVKLAAEVAVLLVGDGLDGGGVDGPAAVPCGEGKCILSHHCLPS